MSCSWNIVNIQFLIPSQTLAFFSSCYEVGMGQKDFVRNVSLFKKNVWRRPLSSRKGDGFTWGSSLSVESGGTGIGTNISHILCVATTAELLTPPCRHLTFYLEHGRTGLLLRWYCRKGGSWVVLFINFDKRGTQGINTPLPDLLCYWITRSISCLGSHLCCSPWGRKGPPGEGAHTPFRLPMAATTGRDFSCTGSSFSCNSCDSSVVSNAEIQGRF